MSDDQVIQTVSSMFIPVAMNLYKLRADRGPGGDLFRSVQKQMDQYQGFWVISPEGKALGINYDRKNDPSVSENRQVSIMLENGLKSFGSLKPRDVRPTDLLPYRGKGIRPDGSVTLALYGRLLHNGQSDGPMMLDSVTLGAFDWEHFVPAQKSEGQRWAIPDPIARSLALSVLSPGDSGGQFRPEDFVQAELQAKVESIKGGKARILLSGKWRAEGLYGGEKGHPHAASATADGFAVYDMEKKSMRSVFLLFSGKVWSNSEQLARSTGGVLEWTFETANARTKS